MHARPAQPDAASVDAAAPTLAVPLSKAPALAEHSDPELVKLFIEEANEELAKISTASRCGTRIRSSATP